MWNDVAVTTESDLLWAGSDPEATPRRPLSRARIVAAAVAVADAEGLGAVSMPRLARELGTAPMSLYRHVPHKDALVDLMLDAAIGPPPATTEGSWRERLATWARANLEVFRRHPWTLPLVTAARRMGPRECEWGETALRAIADVGLEPTDRGLVLALVNGYVRGAAVPVADRAPDPSAIERSGRAAELPLLLALLAATPSDGDDDAGFEFGLARVLDGVQAHFGLRA
jgi:AcrR family transcriptional regulator